MYIIIYETHPKSPGALAMGTDSMDLVVRRHHRLHLRAKLREEGRFDDEELAWRNLLRQSAKAIQLRAIKEAHWKSTLSQMVTIWTGLIAANMMQPICCSLFNHAHEHSWFLLACLSTSMSMFFSRDFKNPLTALLTN